MRLTGGAFIKVRLVHFKGVLHVLDFEFVGVFGFFACLGFRSTFSCLSRVVGVLWSLVFEFSAMESVVCESWRILFTFRVGCMGRRCLLPLSTHFTHFSLGVYSILSYLLPSLMQGSNRLTFPDFTVL